MLAARWRGASFCRGRRSPRFWKVDPRKERMGEDDEVQALGVS